MLFSILQLTTYGDIMGWQVGMLEKGKREEARIIGTASVTETNIRFFWTYSHIMLLLN